MSSLINLGSVDAFSANSAVLRGFWVSTRSLKSPKSQPTFTAAHSRCYVSMLADLRLLADFYATLSTYPMTESVDGSDDIFRGVCKFAQTGAQVLTPGIVCCGCILLELFERGLHFLLFQVSLRSDASTCYLRRVVLRYATRFVTRSGHRNTFERM